jgi:CRP-like cAMP-binding protein
MRLKDSLGNRLLAAVPRDEYELILPDLESVSLSLGEVVYELGEQLNFAYFPTTSVVSLVYTMENGATAEIGSVGNDGLVGITLLTGGGTRPNRAVVRHPGGALRMKANVFQEAFKHCDCLQALLLRYVQALITQISQTAVCNGLHSVEQRLARWLLLTHDRLGSDDLQVTHELVSNLLGVRREWVTRTARNLRDRGLIGERRGHITILNRVRLEEAACECYRVVRDEYDRLLDFGKPQLAALCKLTRL